MGILRGAEYLIAIGERVKRLWAGNGHGAAIGRRVATGGGWGEEASLGATLCEPGGAARLHSVF